MTQVMKVPEKSFQVFKVIVESFKEFSIDFEAVDGHYLGVITYPFISSLCALVYQLGLVGIPVHFIEEPHEVYH